MPTPAWEEMDCKCLPLSILCAAMQCSSVSQPRCAIQVWSPLHWLPGLQWMQSCSGKHTQIAKHVTNRIHGTWNIVANVLIKLRRSWISPFSPSTPSARSTSTSCCFVVLNEMLWRQIREQLDIALQVWQKCVIEVLWQWDLFLRDGNVYTNHTILQLMYEGINLECVNFERAHFEGINNEEYELWLRV